MSSKRWVLVVGLVLIVSSLLVACGGDDDSDPISFKDLSYEGTCAHYDLRIEFSGKDGHQHTIQQLVPGTDEVIAVNYWGQGGIMFWRDLTCDADQTSWVEAENLCRYEVRIDSENDPDLVSKRKSIDVKCD